MFNATCFILLAQGSRLDHLTSQFRRGRSHVGMDDMMFWLLVLAVLILLVWSATVVHGWVQQMRRRPGPVRLFFRLCRAHRLGVTDVRLLWKLAQAQRLRDPARLFMEPERFQKAYLGEGLQPHAQRMAALRDRLFAEEEPSQTERPEDPGRGGKQTRRRTEEASTRPGGGDESGAGHVAGSPLPPMPPSPQLPAGEFSPT